MTTEANQIEDVKRCMNKPYRFIGTFFLLILLLVLVVTGFYQYLLGSPANFPIQQEFSIDPGTSFSQIAFDLEKSGYIKSANLMRIRQYLRHEPLVIKASVYKFETALDLPDLELELSKGDFNNDLLVITHKEGESVVDIARAAASTLTQFDEQKFITLAKPYEGQLFPDTYHVPADFTEEELLKLLLDSFNKKTKDLESAIMNSSFTLEQIVTLASIIEREANDEESMKMVSGILQNRLKINMPLQADATMEYVLKKPLKELTADDLKQESPYNTYLNTGLPPTAIGNPGLMAIEAVLEPTSSDYLFYITGNDGNFYYAKDFSTHKLNIAKYLR